MIKNIYKKLIPNIIPTGVKLKDSPQRSETRQGCPIAPLLNTTLEVLANAIKEQKDITSIHIRKEDIKLSLFTDDMIVYVENLK